MPDSLGSLVDRLGIVNLKIWFAQDTLYKAAAAGTGLDAETVQKLTSLNLERNRLMTAIDVCLQEAVSSGAAQVDDRIKLVP